MASASTMHLASRRESESRDRAASLRGRRCSTRAEVGAGVAGAPVLPCRRVAPTSSPRKVLAHPAPWLPAVCSVILTKGIAWPCRRIGRSPTLCPLPPGQQLRAVAALVVDQPQHRLETRERRNSDGSAPAAPAPATVTVSTLAGPRGARDGPTLAADETLLALLMACRDGGNIGDDMTRVAVSASCSSPHPSRPNGDAWTRRTMRSSTVGPARKGHGSV
ncbi:hypothetical protein DCS_06230 [Drechmeria coniospora]|uniref:Uncharacterized protein n=1 Tax=Drechmeria coniospora TaxID=98403 RepID=A0A151GB36_DRECN|nr:hypothetical protein DCS_06230 [Drechmeria coniospora]KYK54273.1 hypothetical protein DCS_06230 [Drechmeria coniospora]